MEPRIENPAMLFPDAMAAIQGLIKSVRTGVVPATTLELVHLRASQINGCAPCVAFGTSSARKSGETDERLDTIAVWRESPYFTDAERAALALAEAATRLADRPDPVPDEIWAAVREHFDEKEAGILVLWIATTNLFNRMNVTTRQPVGSF